MRSLSDEALKVLTDVDAFFDIFGELLGQQWHIKPSITNYFSNPNIEEIYKLGIQNGGLGGKLLGAGRGGFFLFYARKERHDAIKSALDIKLLVPFHFEDTGSKIVHYSHE